MSTYLEMWVGVKNLGLVDIDSWIERLSPATGTGVVFNGVRVSDVDLLEALRFQRDDLIAMKQILDQPYDISRVLQIFMDEGMIIDHRQENFD